MEPRLRLVGGRAYGEPNNEVGVLLRGALGAVSRAGYTPRLVAPGLYLAHNTRKNPNRGNWYFMLMYRHGFLSKTGPQSANSSTDMVSAGLGYYK
jgi:hypothetical protein